MLELTQAGVEIADAATRALNAQVFSRYTSEQLSPLAQEITRIRLEAGDFAMPEAAPDPLM